MTGCSFKTHKPIQKRFHCTAKIQIITEICTYPIEGGDLLNQNQNHQNISNQKAQQCVLTLVRSSCSDSDGFGGHGPSFVGVTKRE